MKHCTFEISIIRTSHSLLLPVLFAKSNGSLLISNPMEIKGGNKHEIERKPPSNIHTPSMNHSSKQKSNLTLGWTSLLIVYEFQTQSISHSDECFFYCFISSNFVWNQHWLQFADIRFEQNGAYSHSACLVLFRFCLAHPIQS